MTKIQEFNKAFVYVMGGLILSLWVLLSIAKYIPNPEVFLIFGFYFAGQLFSWLYNRFEKKEKNATN